MFHRPVCSKCELEFVPILNEVDVIDYNDNGAYLLSMADEWECPDCRFRIIRGFGEPYMHRSQDVDKFHYRLESLKNSDAKRLNYCDTTVKALWSVLK